MIKSPYATQYTHMQQEGNKNPIRDMTNRMAQQKPARKAAWEARQSKSKKG